MIQLRTLGQLDVRATDGISIDPLLAQPKRLAVLAYLALARPRGFQRRDVVLGLFWPESDATHAREALNQALRFLRRSLGPETVCSRGDDEVAVDRSRLWCDVLDFEERLAAGNDAEALALYRGEFLEGFFLSEAPAFERWLDAERTRLQALARGAATRLAARSQNAGNLEDAMQWARRALALAPYDETALRRLLQLLDSAGDRASAIREYDAFANRLRAELDVEPAPETKAVLTGIRARGARNEAARPARAAPAMASHPPQPASDYDAARASSRIRRLPARAIAAAIVALVMIAGFGVITLSKQESDLDPRRIVVLPLENRTGDSALAAIGMIAADWIVQGLARTDVVDVVPSSHALQLLETLTEKTPSQNAGARTQDLADASGAGTAVTGTYHWRGDDLEFQVQVIDVSRDRLLHAVEGVRGPREDPMRAVEQLRRRIVGAVAFHFDERARPTAHRELRPPSYEAYQAFVAGMDERSHSGPRQALPYFHRAYALDTTFTTAIFLAAIQHHNLRELPEADSLLRIFSRSREQLPRLERLFLDWMEAKIRGDHAGALESARRLADFDDDFRGQVVFDALLANRPREAVDAGAGQPIEHLSERWKLAYSRRRTDAYHRLGSHRRELAEAKRARQRHPDRVEPLLWEMRALAALNRAQPARERLEEALAMATEAEWPRGEILLRAADELRAHGVTRSAQNILPRAIAWYGALPDSQARLLRHRRYAAAALLRADSLPEAEQAFAQLAREFPADPFYIASVAVIRAREGDRRAAMQIAQTLLSRNPPYDYGHHIYERARIAAQLGNADHTIRLLREAFARGFDFAFVGGSRGGTAAVSPDGSPHLDPAFDGLREHAGFQELARGRH